MVSFSVNNVYISILGKHPIIKYILNELSLFPNTDHDPHLTFYFTNSKIQQNDGIRIDNIIANENSIFITNGSFDYKIIFDEPCNYTKILLRPKVCKENYIIQNFNKFLDWNYLTKLETLAKDFMYNIFDYLLHLKMLKYGGAFIHASSVEKDGKAYVFTGWGGTGKTSILIRLVMRDQMNFLSDDLSIINSREKSVYLNPKFIQIYPYNVRGDHQLYRKLMGNRSLFDKLNWHWRRIIYGSKGVRRRVSPKELFGSDRIGSKAEIYKVLFFARSVKNKYEIKRISPSKMALLNANIIIPELHPLSQYIYQLHAVGCNLIPSLDFIFQKTMEIYEKSFNGKECYYVVLPSKAPPNDVYDFIKMVIEE